MRDFAFTIDVPVRNEWGSIDLVVTSVQSCFNAMFADVDGSHAIAMVAGELLENAIKYGYWSDGRHMFRLHIEGRERTASIVVENPVRDEEDAGSLLRTIRWLRTFDDPHAAYRARLLEVAQSDTPDTSGLGLVRMAFEGRCTLDATVAANVVRVTARLSL